MLITKYYIIIFPGSILAKQYFIHFSQTANKQATEKEIPEPLTVTILYGCSMCIIVLM